jgi:hypothetical protein
MKNDPSSLSSDHLITDWVTKQVGFMRAAANPVCGGHKETAKNNAGEGEKVVCKVEPCAEDKALLIAAAPALLEALKAAYDALPYGNETLAIKCKKAIAAANPHSEK